MQMEKPAIRQALPGCRGKMAGKNPLGAINLKLHFKDMFNIIQRIPRPEALPCN